MNRVPNTREKIGIVINNLEMFGLRQTVRDALLYLLAHQPDGFDAKHGVSTAGTVMPSQAQIQDIVAFENAFGYEPTREAVMQHILNYIAANLTPASFTFVDLGCGKGRAVLMASELPFKEVIGVEISELHCEAARRNVSIYLDDGAAHENRHANGSHSNGSSKGANGDGHGGLRRRRNAPVRISCADVTQFDFPNTDLMVYMFNPFRGPVFRAVLDRLADLKRKQPERRIYVTLSAPGSDYLLHGHPAFVLRHEFRVISHDSSWNFWECRLVQA